MNATDDRIDASQVTDCHVHLVDDRYPMQQKRSYTPKPAPLSDLRLRMNSLGIGRAVFVQISVYGNDNSLLLDSLAEMDGQARGVIHLAGGESLHWLSNAHAAGVRAVRLNLFSNGTPDVADISGRLQEAADVCKRMGWHIQLLALPGTYRDLRPVLERLTVPVVLDHFALLSAVHRGTPEEDAVFGLLRREHMWIKLSASYRLDGSERPDAVATLAADLSAASDHSVIWGTDWPHPPVHQGLPVLASPEKPYRNISAEQTLQEVRQWFPASVVRRKLLVDNPAQLFGF